VTSVGALLYRPRGRRLFTLMPLPSSVSVGTLLELATRVCRKRPAAAPGANKRT